MMRKGETKLIDALEDMMKISKEITHKIACLRNWWTTQKIRFDKKMKLTKL